MATEPEQTPDPRFLGGETAVLVDTALMALALTIGWDGAADIRCHVDKPQAANMLRRIADVLDAEAAVDGPHGIER